MNILLRTPCQILNSGSNEGRFSSDGHTVRSCPLTDLVSSSMSRVYREIISSLLLDTLSSMSTLSSLPYPHLLYSPFPSLPSLTRYSHFVSPLSLLCLLPLLSLLFPYTRFSISNHFRFKPPFIPSAVLCP